MTTLLIDALIVLVKTVDRGMSAVERSVRLRFSPRTVVDVQPAGAAAPASAHGTGGHPHLRPTSELLWLAAHCCAEGELAAQLRDRAAQFAAIAD